MNLYEISLPFSSALSLVLGLFILFKAPKSAVNRLWFLMSLAVSAWSGLFALSLFTPDQHTGLLYARLTNISACFIPILFYHFCLSLLSIHDRRALTLLYFGYLSCFVITAFGFHPAFIPSVRSTMLFKHYSIPGPLYVYFTFIFFLFTVASELLLFKSLRRTSGLLKEQVRYVFIATIIGYATGSMTFLPIYGIDIEPITVHFLWVYHALISYAIIKHQLLDIKIVLRRTFFFSAAAFSISMVYVLGLFFFQQLFNSGTDLRKLLFHSFGLYWLPSFIGSLTFFALTVFIFSNRPRTRHKLLFGLLCFEVFYWQIIWLITFFIEDLATIDYLAKSSYITITLLPFTFYYLIVSYIKNKSDIFATRICFLFAFALIGTLHSSSIYIQGSRPRSWGHFTDPGPAFLLFMVASLIVMIRSLWLLHRYLQVPTLSSQDLNKGRYLFYSLSILFFCSLDFFQVYGAPWFPIRTFFFILSFGLIAYSLTKHHVLDVYVAIRKTSYFAVFAIVLSLVYSLLIGVFYYLVITKQMLTGMKANLALILLIAISFKPIEIWIYRSLERYFFRGSISELASQKELLEVEVEKSDRLRSVATLAAGMAHEIKNPLTSIRTFAEYLPEKYNDPEFRDKFKKIVVDEVDRVNSIVQQLLDFSKPKEPELKPVAIADILDETLGLITSRLLTQRIEVKKDYRSFAEIPADRHQLKQAFLNLFINSIQAMPAGGTLSVSTSLTDKGRLLVSIADTGMGIPKESLPHIFDPFYTTKDGGTGLGLSIVHGIITKHGGKLWVESRVGHGTVISAVLRNPA